MTQIKICGIKDPENLQAACRAGARFVGFVFHEPSPRHVSFDTASNLARALPTGVRSVGLFVDPRDEEITHITSSVPLDMLQLHGSETSGRIIEIKNLVNMPVIKAIPVASQDDLENIEDYEAVADWLLFDSKPGDSHQSGGTGKTFDWNVLKSKKFTKPWMLSGGLHSENISEALSILQPNGVDVSSGVEKNRGQKDPDKIRDFIRAVNDTKNK